MPNRNKSPSTTRAPDAELLLCVGGPCAGRQVKVPREGARYFSFARPGSPPREIEETELDHRRVHYERRGFYDSDGGLVFMLAPVGVGGSATLVELLAHYRPDAS